MSTTGAPVTHHQNACNVAPHDGNDVVPLNSSAPDKDQMTQSVGGETVQQHPRSLWLSGHFQLIIYCQLVQVMGHRFSESKTDVQGAFDVPRLSQTNNIMNILRLQ